MDVRRILPSMLVEWCSTVYACGMKKEKKHIRLVDYDREIHDHIAHVDLIPVFLLFGPNFKVDKVG